VERLSRMLKTSYTSMNVMAWCEDKTNFGSGIDFRTSIIIEIVLLCQKGESCGKVWLISYNYQAAQYYSLYFFFWQNSPESSVVFAQKFSLKNIKKRNQKSSMGQIDRPVQLFYFVLNFNYFYSTTISLLTLKYIPNFGIECHRTILAIFIGPVAKTEKWKLFFLWTSFHVTNFHSSRLNTSMVYWSIHIRATIRWMPNRNFKNLFHRKELDFIIS